MFSDSKHFSSSLLLTLAEFSSLIIFAGLLLLVALRSELGVARRAIGDLTHSDQTNRTAAIDLQRELAQTKQTNELLSQELVFYLKSNQTSIRIWEQHLALTKETNKQLMQKLDSYSNSLEGLSSDTVKEKLLEADRLKLENTSLRDLVKVLGTATNDSRNSKGTLIKLRIAEQHVNWLRATNEMLNRMIWDLASANAALAERIRSLEVQSGLLVTKLRSTQQTIVAENKSLVKMANSEFRIRVDLIGMKQDQLERVAVLFDMSSSMQQSGSWLAAQQIVTNWLTYLPIVDCVLLKFSSSVSAYPASGFIRLREGEERTSKTNNLSGLLQRLGVPTFGPYTDTLAALQNAYRYPRLTMILMFTDGRPQTETQSFERLRDRIYALVEQHNSIPIHIIGLGDYEQLQREDVRAKKNLEVEFLRKIAKMTGGSFSAR